MSIKMWSGLLLLLGIIIIVSNSVYTVDEREFAVKFALGKFSDSNISSGLHFKTPFINNIKKFDKRIQTYDVNPQLFTTSDSQLLNVDYFIKWRIDNVEDFYTKNTTGVNPINREAEGRLFAVVNKALLDIFASKSKQQVVSTERNKIMKRVTKETNLISTGLLANSVEPTPGRDTSGFGIRIIDVRIKRIELPEDVLLKTFERMKSERNKVARQHRANGIGEANKIQAEADKRKVIILADAEQKAQILRGEGDAKAAAIYAKAYTRNPEFYAFYRSLDAYKKSFNNNDFLVMEPNSDFFSYFKNQKAKK